MTDADKLKDLQEAVQKFLYDIEFVPPWESAGAVWAQKVIQLHKALLASAGVGHSPQEGRKA